MLKPQTFPFLDWHGVWAGHVNYDVTGNYFPQDLPRGIRLAVQPAQLSAPVMRREKRWEAGNIHYPALRKEGDRYRLWYGCFASQEDPWVKAGNIPGKYPALWCYAESGDGFHWERPSLGLYAYDGSRDNNILFACGEVGPYGYMHLMRDPQGSEAERYKAIGIAAAFHIDGRPATPQEALELTGRLQAAGDGGSIGERISRQVVITGGVSPDGLRWTHLKEPIMAPPWLLDTQNILAFDPDIGKYLIFLRSGRERRRAVSRYEAENFRGPWGNHHMVLTVDPQDPPDWDIYAPCYCRHPHGAHLMFFNPFHRASDLMDVHLAISHDGLLWSRPERRPVIPLHERYGTLYPAPELVPLGEDCWGVLVLGCPHPHDLAGVKEPSEYCWAMWKRDRLVALEAEDYAEFALTERECAGEPLRLNFQTRQPGAWIKVEIVDGRLPNRASAALPPALAGHSFAECDPLAGDELEAVVSWRGNADLSSLRGQKIHLRLRMARARLFAVTL